MATSQPPPSQLDEVIPAEIANDRFSQWIARVAATPGVRHILEIGSSSGAGSTHALVEGARQNVVLPSIHCLEVSIPRFAALTERYAGCDFVHCYNMSSVPLDAFPTPADIDAFRARVWTRFRFIRRQEVHRWLAQDIAYLQQHGLSSHGVRTIRERLGIDYFDAVLIDGSEFAGPAELTEVYGARFLLLDDVRTFKNYDNDRALRRDPQYRLVARGRRPRNGFAIYERVDVANTAVVP